ncbi:MAG: DNA polymerase III subunit alpha [Candidatus Anoxychlamydiales bacterium]|nr:DNA polymerase III subunit alpha [Candidatus Anoxychlamydiales bacterium]
MSYISLHNHSGYSILDSTISIKKLVNLAYENNMSAIALTDSYNMHGAVEFYKTCVDQNIKPILGCELWVASSSRFEKKKKIGKPLAYPIVLLVKNEIGYKNLCILSSKGFLEGFYYYPRIDKELLKQHSEGLICLSGPVHSSLNYQIINSSKEDIENEINWFKEVYKDDYYLELQNHEMSNSNLLKDGITNESFVMQKYEELIKREKKINETIENLKSKYQIKSVATNDVHYAKKEDWRGHEILLNIASGEAVELWERDLKGNRRAKTLNPKRKLFASHEYYFKNHDDMEKIFSKEAIDSTLEIADKCDFHFDFKKKHYPIFIPPDFKDGMDRKKAAEDYLYSLCKDAIEKRYTLEALEKIKEIYPNEDPIDIVKKRLNLEFDLLVSKEICDYFLIVYDFIAWAKKRKIPVGPGRGSAAGSIISYLIGITDIEPLRFNLFFERFINPERMSYPDIDVDICMDRRSEVIDYTVQKYGSDKVAQIITFGTMKAKMAIKDVGRVLSVPIAKVNEICKLVPDDLNITIENALKIDPELNKFYSLDEEVKQVLDIAKTVEGSIRNTSTHAAGIIISENSLTENIPICVAKDAQMVVTQYSMKPVESIGLLKIDFLGLKTLTSIQKCIDAIEKSENLKIDLEKLPLNDKNTFNLLNKGKTLGVFQLESSGMQALAKDLRLDRFEEIIAVGALYRPGPMDMIPSFIARKHGREKIEIAHPLMKDILKETYGVMVYQEQVMQIASKIAGYSLGEGDVLRRAMGKKDHNEMQRQREKFVKGCVNNNISKNIAITIFDKIEKFASYGFNKSHATAYAFISYVTAYMKANYTSQWMAALLTCDRYDISKVAKFISESKSLNIPILPPDVNEAEDEFLATKKGIRFAMSAIKGIGSNVVEEIVKTRKKKGAFKDFYDFIKKVNLSKIGKKTIELLIDAGGFDFASWTRDQMKVSIEPMYDSASKEQKENAKGVMNFLNMLDKDKSNFTNPPTINNVRDELEVLQKEKELLGFYLTNHPMDKYTNLLKQLSCVPLKEIESMPDKSVVRIAFIIDDVKFRISKNQRKFAILTISDGMNKLEVPIWPELFSQKYLLLEENKLIYSVISIDKSSSTLRINCKWLDDLTKADNKMIKECDLMYDKIKNNIKFFDKKRKNGFNNNNKKKEIKKIMNTLKIKVDADTVKLSSILKLKKLFKTSPGNAAIEVVFSSKDKQLKAYEVDPSYKVSINDQMLDLIRNIEGVIALDVS